MKTSYLTFLILFIFYFSCIVSANAQESGNLPTAYLTTATENAATLNPAEKPKISVQHGFYKKPFDVVVSTGIDNMDIYYTLDGSDPAQSVTAKVLKSPAKIAIDPQNFNGRGKTPGVVLRARAKSSNYDFSPIATSTYLFVDKMAIQTTFPGHDWPQSNINGQYIDLQIDSRVLNDPLYQDLIDDALLEIPSISITTNNMNLFGSDSGIYVNADFRGAEWERPASIELINPDGTKGFQIDAGLRIRGGYSRNPFFRKHAFRLFFRDEYGAGKLEFPLFEDEGVKQFDKIDLRCAQNYSWSKGGEESPHYTFARDVFSRDVQGKMNHEYTKSRYYHLYINGLYWGLYQSQERSEARFAADYMGGEAEDYDVVKRAGEGNSIEATDGNLDTWKEIWDLCVKGFESNADYYKIQGLNASGVRDTKLKVLVDIDNLIDYMNIIFYTGNYDAPVSAFMDNKGSNNFYAIYNRNSDRGFTFFAHDNEHTLLTDPINMSLGLKENRVNIGSIKGANKMEVTNFEQFHPQWLHFKLSQNAEYRQRFSDRSYKLYFNNGILTPERVAKLFQKRTDQIDTAVIAESARWGDVDGIVRTKADWQRAVDRVLNGFFPYRTDIVIKQLQDEKLLSKINAPVFDYNGNEISAESIALKTGDALKIANPNATGNITYTFDGSDPRMVGDAISAKAVNGGMATTISVLQNCIVKARVFDNGVWSPLHTLNLTVDTKPEGLQITEINYNPIGFDGISGSEYEFIELKNNGVVPVNLTAALFSNGIKFNFNEETLLDPGKFIVLASNSYAFNLKYGFMPFGEYEGQLDNKGEKLTLIDAVGDTLVSFSYNNQDPWPTTPDSLGFTLVPAVKGLSVNWNDGKNWRASSAINGSPNADDNAVEVPKIIINEILTNSETPQTDAIELYNPNDFDVNIGNWYLSDKRTSPKKWKIPAETIIPANGYVTFNEGHYENSTLLYSAAEFGSSFSLSSLGEEVYLFSGSSTGELTGYEFGFDFGAIEPGVSIGRYINSLGKEHYVAQQSTSFNAANGLPRVGPVILNQIMYNPAADQFEFLELTNTSTETVNLFDATNKAPWKISGIDFVFPANVSIEPGQSIYLVEKDISPSDFKSLFNLESTSLVFNFTGKLKNEGEEITLFKAYQSYFENNVLKVPYIKIDKVDYNDNSTWPDADGNGKVLQRKELTAYSNDPLSWIATSPEMRIKNTNLPNAILGVHYEKELTAVGGIKPYSWSISKGELPNGLTVDPVKGVIEGTATDTGSFALKLRVEDAALSNKEVELLLTVIPNTLPMAVNDSVYVPKNHAGNFNVLANDTDNDGDKPSWSIEIATQPAHGTAIVNNDLTITYSANRDYMGTDELTYRVTDIAGSSEAKMVVSAIYEDSPVLVTYQFIAISTDDAEENIATKQINLTGRTLEMAYDAQGNAKQLVGLRYQNVKIPEGSIIREVYLIFNSGKVDASVANLTIQGEASLNPKTYSTTDIISIRPTTKAKVAWKPEPWNEVDEQAYFRLSANLAPIVNELIGMGWKSGNSMAFMISGEGNRSARSFNGGGQWNSPVLYIIYSDPKAVPTTPIAVLNSASKVSKNDLVQLDGTSSNSPDTRPLNYYWTITSKPEGSNAQLSNPRSPAPSFVADMFGQYNVSLKVDNGLLESGIVNATIEALNHAPIANAGSNQTRIRGSLIHLNGSGSNDPNGDMITYNWEWIQKPTGSSAQLTSTSEANPKFTADLEGNYSLSLTVYDQYSLSAKDTVEINSIANQAPLANAGNDIETVINSIVVLNGTKSSDPEEDQLTYNWSMVAKPTGSLVELSDSTLGKPAFQPDVAGEYVIQLSVSDGINSSMPDEVRIVVTNNVPPLANAGNEQITTERLTVVLDGSESFDPDGKALLYQWSFVTKPFGSNALLLDANTAKPSFQPDTEGLYTLKLRVSDGTFTSEDQVQIEALNSVDVEMQKTFIGLNAYPNPFAEHLVVNYSTPSKQKVEFSLMNISGAVIKRFVFATNGESTQVLNFENDNLRAGIYLLLMKPENGEPKTLKVVHE
jgi:hypothetical protein